MKYEMVRAYHQDELIAQLEKLSDRYEVVQFTAYLDTETDDGEAKECLLCLLVQKGKRGLFEPLPTTPTEREV